MTFRVGVIPKAVCGGDIIPGAGALINGEDISPEVGAAICGTDIPPEAVALNSGVDTIPEPETLISGVDTAPEAGALSGGLAIPPEAVFIGCGKDVALELMTLVCRLDIVPEGMFFISGIDISPEVMGDIKGMGMVPEAEALVSGLDISPEVIAANCAGPRTLSNSAVTAPSEGLLSGVDTVEEAGDLTGDGEIPAVAEPRTGSGHMSPQAVAIICGLDFALEADVLVSGIDITPGSVGLRRVVDSDAGTEAFKGDMVIIPEAVVVMCEADIVP